MKENIKVTRFSNGLVILTDPMPGVRSATVGFWLRKGSRHEPAHLNGILHFIEHTVFKGTSKRTALDIAIESDRLGGNLDAFTTHDMTGFVAKVADNEFENAFDLLADMLSEPLFDPKELKREQGVIIEEIKMVEDSPEEILGELFGRRFFPDNPLGAPIEGTRKTVRSFNRAITAEFHASMYQPRNLVITCAGNIEHKKAVALAGRLFKNKASAKTDFKTKKPRSAAPIILKKNPHLEQAHLLIGTPWVMVSDKRRYAANILTGILGDGNSSRLWQTIREERGLAYSVGASESCFADTGIFNIFAACSPAKLKEVTSLCIAEMRRIKADGVTDSELRLAKDQIKASILLSLEDSTARATTLARQEVFYGQQIPVDETIRKIEAVTKEEVRSLARTFFRTEKVALAALGDIGNTRISRSDLEV